MLPKPAETEKKIFKEPVPATVREKRTVKAPERLTYIFKVPTPDDHPPKTLGEARKNDFWEGYKGAIQEEIKSLEENKTWELVDLNSLPRGTNI